MTKNSTARVNIFFFLCFFIFFIFLFSYSPEPGSGTIYSNYGYFVLSLSFIISIIITLNKKYKIKINQIGAFLFFLIYILIIISSIFKLTFLSALIVTIPQVMFIFLVFNIKIIYSLTDEDYIKLLCYLIIGLSLISFMIALWVYLAGEISIGPIEIVQPYYRYFRFRGWYQSANKLGPVFCVSSICILYILIRNKRHIKLRDYLLLVTFLSINLVGLLLTGSRGSIFAFLCSIILLFTLFKLFSLKDVFMIILALILIIFLINSSYSFLGITWDFYLTDIARLSETMIEEESRLLLWSYTGDILQSASVSEILLGHGNNYFIIYTGFSPHNGYVRFFIDYGLIFSIIFVFFIIHLYIKLFSKKILGYWGVSLLTFLLIRDIFNLGILYTQFEGFVFLFIILFAFTSIKARKKEKG